MKTARVIDHIRRRIDKYINHPPHRERRKLQTLRITEWSSLFEALMRARLLIGNFRYGALGSPEKEDYDNVSSAIERLKLYREDGNLEHLVDVANISMVEFVHSKHPLKHFKSGDDGIHVERKAGGFK